MKNAYPIILTPAEEGGYVVYVPDFDINTQGDDLADAMFMARDAIGLVGIDMEDSNESLPSPSAMTDISCGTNELVTLVDVDFLEYRKRNSTKAVKKNCSIPEWLNDAATAKGVNFSQVLQDGLKAELGL